MDLQNSKKIPLIQFPQEQCSLHNYEYIYISIEEDKLQKRCLRCITQCKIDTSKLILISDVFNQQINIVENWLLFDMNSLSESQNQGFLQYQQHSSFYQQLSESIHQYFDDFQREVNDLIMERKKEMLSQLERLNSISQTLQTSYDQVSNIELFRQNMINNDEKLQNYLGEMQNIKDINTQRIQNATDSYHQIINSIDTQTAPILKQEIINLIGKINFFNKVVRNENGVNQLDNNQSEEGEEIPEIKPKKQNMNNRNIIQTNIRSLLPGTKGQTITGQVQVEQVNQKGDQTFVLGRVADEGGNIKFEIRKPKNLEIESGKVYTFQNLINKVNNSGFHFIDLNRYNGKIFLSSKEIQNPVFDNNEPYNRSAVEYVRKVVNQ